MKLLIVTLCGFFLTTFGRQGFGPTDQEWGYVTVRDGAHMFWWLHYTTATTNHTEKPLIIWLQGGPGASSTQYGNFEELGPIDSNLNPRDTTWVQHANVLFVDNPVGTGFSYVYSVGRVVEHEKLAANNTQIAKDFVSFLQSFYKELPQFEDVPLYIFGESYGGKMTAEIALRLHQTIKQGQIKSNFKGVGLGDSWISPVETCLSWSIYLYELGLLDAQQFNEVNKNALDLKKYADKGDWHSATSAWSNLAQIIKINAGNVDIYNVLTKRSKSSLEQINTLKRPFGKSLYENKALGKLEANIASDLMNNKVKPALNLTSIWGEQADLIFSSLSEDFMKPVTDIVERLLSETNLTVAVYNGQLDLIVDTPGTIAWVDKLNFKGSEEWLANTRKPFAVDGFYEGFEKKAGNLVFYWVLRAGHMVPRDNPNAMLYILQQVTNNFKV